MAVVEACRNEVGCILASVLIDRCFVEIKVTFFRAFVYTQAYASHCPFPSAKLRGLKMLDYKYVGSSALFRTHLELQFPPRYHKKLFRPM